MGRYDGLPPGVPPGPRTVHALLPDVQSLDEPAVVPRISPPQIPEEPATLSHQHHQASPRVEVLRVLTEVLCQLTDATGEEGDLDLGGARIELVKAIFLHDAGFRLLIHSGLRDALCTQFSYFDGQYNIDATTE